METMTTGARFGRWTVTGPSFMKDAGHRMVPCQCDCGTERNVLVFALRNGQSSSCGCRKAEVTAAQSVRLFTTHGQTGTPLYMLWKKIKRRCHNPGAHNYRYYGGRGIKLCDEWREDAGAFIAYVERELGPRPGGKTPGGAQEYSIDRINNDGHYEPGNIRWATYSQQVPNRRTARL